MLKGFYSLTSAMLTQQRDLNVVANNMVNISTAGYKSDTYTSSTFDQVMFSRVGNKYKGGREDIGEISYIRASDQMYTDFTQGALEQTNIPLDFAIVGDGFFAVQTDDGQVAYTRQGNFSLDDQGYLWLQGAGRVLGSDGQPIQLNTDKIRGDSKGNLYAENGGYLGTLGVWNFQDTGALEHNEQGLFTGGQAQLMQTPQVQWGYLERSNVEMIDQMTEMLTAQRALQSAAQVTKMYDEIMTQATQQVGRLS
ncbi:MAG: flagellar hook-basal body protein [Acutalibacter sp.]|jgi:flagellar basal-body rod protein FlgF